MTERLSDVEARIGSVQQLAAVVTAMRGIAAARAREARAHLDGIRAYAQTIAVAIGDALAFLPEQGQPVSGPEPTGGHAIIALCAEQGFAGTFSKRVLDAVGRLASAAPKQRSEVLLIGDRGLLVADEKGMKVDWSAPMAAHVGEAAALADRIVEALYERLEAGRVRQVTLVHAVPGPSAAFEIAEKVLVPFDFRRFPTARRTTPPLVTLPPQALLAGLVEEYVFAEICEAVMLSVAAENEARMRAMLAARTNVEETLHDLIALSRQLRQEEITDEIIELVGGSGAPGA
jgi:F-type H+-transporting ATPase subunit gamma